MSVDPIQYYFYSLELFAAALAIIGMGCWKIAQSGNAAAEVDTHPPNPIDWKSFTVNPNIVLDNIYANPNKKRE